MQSTPAIRLGLSGAGGATEGLFQAKLINTRWRGQLRGVHHKLGANTTDLWPDQGYDWLDPKPSINYGTNGMPWCNQMYYNASESGTIGTIPEIPGLAVWRDGHVGVYIGNGYIEAMGTKCSVVRLSWKAELDTLAESNTSTMTKEENNRGKS